MKIKILICDVDGTLTDGKVTIDSNGNSSKSFSVIDGMGLALCKLNGIKLAWVTGSDDLCIKQRATQLNMLSYLILESKDKVKDIEEQILKPENITWDNVAYIGDDINDIDAINKAAFTAVPANAIIRDLNTHNFTCTRNGGDGAVREFIEKLIAITLHSSW